MPRPALLYQLSDSQGYSGPSQGYTPGHIHLAAQPESLQPLLLGFFHTQNLMSQPPNLSLPLIQCPVATLDSHFSLATQLCSHLRSFALGVPLPIMLFLQMSVSSLSTISSPTNLSFPLFPFCFFSVHQRICISYTYLIVYLYI